MNLKHGFDSNNLLLNPDMQLLQRSGKSVFARTVEHLLNNPHSNVGMIYTMRMAGAQEAEKRLPLHVYFDRLMSEAKNMPTLSNRDKDVITYFCDAVFLIDKLNIPTHTPLNKLDFDPNDKNNERRFLGQAMRALYNIMKSEDTCQAAIP